MASPNTRYKRRMTVPSRYSIRMYAALTAESIWAWNRLHSVLFEIFTAFLGDRTTAYAIWHVFQSDSNQRGMLLEVAIAKFPPRSRELTKIKWLLKTINAFAPYRNAVIHVPLVFQPNDEGQPNAIHIDEAGAREQAKTRLELAGSGERFWNSFAGDLFVLGQYAGAILERLEASNSEPGNQPLLPSLQRPRLPCLQLLKEIDREISLRRSPQAPTRRKRS